MLLGLFGFLWWYASQTALQHVAVVGKLSFDDYRYLTASLAVAALLGLIDMRLGHSSHRLLRKPWPRRAILIASGAIPLAVLRHGLIPWMPIPILLGFCGPAVVRTWARDQGAMRRSDIAALLAIGLLAASITFVSHRPDPDDGGFLDIAISHLQYPHLPLFGFDASHGELFPRFRFIPYASTSYEILIALLARATAIDLLDVYYGIVPTAFAFICVLAIWALFREIIPGSAVLATAICVLLIVVWGETHIAYGNRLFVRFFQGKGPLIGIAVPLCVLGAIRVMKQPTFGNWTLLCSAQLLSVGLSSSGLIVGPVAAAVGGLASLIAGHGRNLKTCFIAATSCAYLAAVALVILLVAPKGIGELGTVLPITASMGGLPRLLLAALIAALAIWMWRRGIEAFPAALAISCIALPLNPAVGALLKTFVSQNMGWRVAWAAPVPLVLAATLAVAISYGFKAKGDRVAKYACVLALLLLLAFVSAGRWTIAPGNGTDINLAMRKLPAAYDEATALTRILAPSSDLVLAPDPIATWLPAQTGIRVRLAMGGHTYPLLMPSIWKPEEFERRHTLYEMVSGRIAFEPDAFSRRMKMLGVGVVIIDGRIPVSTSIAKLLSEQGCAITALGSGSPISLWRCRGSGSRSEAPS